MLTPEEDEMKINYSGQFITGQAVAFTLRYVSGIISSHALVAQLDRVMDFESRGWEFEPPRGHFFCNHPFALVSRPALFFVATIVSMRGLPQQQIE